MKLVTFMQAGEERLGFLRGDDVVDPLRMSGDPAMFGSAMAFIKAGDKALKAAQVMVANPLKSALIPRERVSLCAPLTPSTILCSGSNYHDHNAEKANTPISGKEPEFFVKTADCVVGPDEPIIYDERLSKKIDCEVELAVVIGKAGRHIPVASALDHVFGYTIVNDVTARDRQVRRTPEGMTWYELGSGKAFNSSAPLGPCIVTADEIGDPQKLALKSRINGELRQSSSTVEHDLDLRPAHSLLLAQLHAQARHGHHHRHAGRHRLVVRQGTRRQRHHAARPGAGDPLLPAGRRRRMRDRKDRRAAQPGRRSRRSREGRADRRRITKPTTKRK